MQRGVLEDRRPLVLNEGAMAQTGYPVVPVYMCELHSLTTPSRGHWGEGTASHHRQQSKTLSRPILPLALLRSLLI
jgi:hypothetical protein